MNRRRDRGAAADRRGRRAETLSLWLLRLKCYRILAKRYRAHVGEIDLIARRGKVLAAIEVKARGDQSLAAHSLAGAQRRRISRALEHFLVSRPELGGLVLRFDVMLVAPGRLPRHLKGAWRVGE